MNQFLGLMLDPFVDGRFGTSGGNRLALRRINRQASRLTSRSPMRRCSRRRRRRSPFDQRWTAWGSGFGAQQHDQRQCGDRLEQCHGSATTALPAAWIITSRRHALRLCARGRRHQLGSGAGTRQRAQRCVPGRCLQQELLGPAYVAAALAFTNNWFTTNRTALGDQLTASFSGPELRRQAGNRLSLRRAGQRRRDRRRRPTRRSRRSGSTRRPTARPIWPAAGLG